MHIILPRLIHLSPSRDFVCVRVSLFLSCVCVKMTIISSSHNEQHQRTHARHTNRYHLGGMDSNQLMQAHNAGILSTSQGVGSVNNVSGVSGGANGGGGGLTTNSNITGGGVGGTMPVGHIVPGGPGGGAAVLGLSALQSGLGIGLLDPLEALLGSFPCAHVRGIPYEATIEDVLVVFQGLVVIDVVMVHPTTTSTMTSAGGGGGAVTNGSSSSSNGDDNNNGNGSSSSSSGGGSTGNSSNNNVLVLLAEAYVVFANPMDFQMGLQRDHQIMGNRYLEIFQGKRVDYYAAIATNYNSQHHHHPIHHHHQQLQNGGSTHIGEKNVGGDNNGGLSATTAAWNKPGSGGNGVTGGPNKTANNNNGGGYGGGYGSGGGGGGGRGGNGGYGYGGRHNNYLGRGGGRGNYSNNHHHHHNRGGGVGENNLHHGNNHHNKGGGVREGIPHTGYIRLRGLPFNTTTEDITTFFKEHNPKVDSALVTYRFDGRATGEGYVAFDSIDDAKSAMTLHRRNLGSRYVELFISNKDEYKRNVSRSTPS